ncbi:MAG: peptidoglycan-associated lipoprotein Pal [Nitrospiraceae bacterium]|nr:peptidoglycan-associated lipoprotein Pal [Nitrospiraceae bacterium]
MKRIFAVVAVLLFSSLFIISGCSSKRVAVADKPLQEKPADTGKTTAGKQTPATTSTKETVTDKVITAKAQPSDSDAAFEEIKSALKDIYFDFDKYDINEAAKPLVKQAAAALSKDSRIKVIIEGHCDERGTNEYNLSLGEKRAFAVKEYLLSLGIPSSRIQTVSYGEEKPVCTESTEECWAKNRRAHFVLVKEK